MTIYPIIFLIFLCIMWTHAAFNVGKEDEVNFVYCAAWTLISGILLYLCGFFAVIHWPQITWICLTTVGCVTALYKHGDTIKNTPTVYLLTLILMIFIYIKGGAFQYFNH